MKIGNSVIQFNTTCTLTLTGDKCTLQNVPYWRLYSRNGDCVQKDIGHQWHSTRVLTYDEIVECLTNYPGHRVLEAYPRFSKDKRRTYEYYYDDVNKEFGVKDKYSGEIVYIVDANTARKVYLSPDYKYQHHFCRKFFQKTADNCLEYTYMAARMMENEW